MIVEVLGVSPANKGAMLMLEAIVEQFRTRLPAATLAIPATMPAAERERLGLVATPKRDMRRYDIARVARLLPSAFRRRGLTPPHAVDVILDASGFGYGDFWGRRKMAWRLLRAARGPGPKGRKLILLPQALGPFTKPGIAATMRAAVTRAALVYARDAVSLDHLHAIGLDGPVIRRAPDFTNLLAPALPERLAPWRGWSYVIPNEKMVAGKGAQARADYVAFVAQAAAAIEASGRRTAILIHEGAADRRIAAEVNATRETPLHIVDEPSPLVTKALLAASDLIVSSRFHGLVSALSAGVPALACGWSHKYRELLSDYGAARHVVDVTDRAQWTPKIDDFLRDAADPEFRASLQAAAREEKARSAAMWDAVFATIAAPANG